MAFCTDPPFIPECMSAAAVSTVTSKAAAPRRPAGRVKLADVISARTV